MLFDPRYWRERQDAMAQVPRQLLVFPRQELALPGGEASELWLRGHDRVRLRALFARSVVIFPRPEIRLRWVDELGAPRLEWDSIADGQPQLVVEELGGRRLEDRVLDLLRTIQAARELAQLHDGRLTLRADPEDLARDEVLIVDRLLADGQF